MNTRAAYVMWHRQIKEYMRNKQRLVVSMVQPLLFLIAFGFGFGKAFESTGGGSYIQYLLPGIVGMTVMSSAMMGGVSLIWDKKFGFLKETLVAPVSRTSLLLGRCLGSTTTSVIQGLIVFSVGHFLGFRMTNYAMFPLTILFMISTALLFSLLGTMLASKFDDMQSFPLIINLLVMPMMFLSGAFFSSGNFPAVLQFIVKINPFNYCVNLLRFSLIGMNTNVILSVFVTGFFIITFGTLGTYFFSKIEA